MNRLLSIVVVVVLTIFGSSCKKNSGSQPLPPPAGAFSVVSVQIDRNGSLSAFNVGVNPLITITFSAPVDPASASGNITLVNTGSGAAITLGAGTLSNKDSVLEIRPSTDLQPITEYSFSISTGLQSRQKQELSAAVSRKFITAIDTTDKFPRISDSALLTLVQQQTFKYFYDFGHPVSGLARERSSSGDVVTSGGSGFGVMALLAGIQRNFITRQQGLARIQTIVNFLATKAQRYHGAFPHWMNGATGATVPFSTQDDGADLVETAYLMQGLLTARQFFNSGVDPVEIAVRDSINSIWNGVEWSWFRQNGQNTLYWHWSPDYNWSTNQQINGWNEAMIVYVLAASATKDSIPKVVYDNGWAGNGSIRNGNTYLGVQLPIGPPEGGPLFFTHYSFLGINPNGLADAYANYWTQSTAHTRINYNYCISNPLGYNGYSAQCWGLTASDEQNGYSAHSPTNDNGVIAPTAAISSLSYTPDESMNALRFFYYKLGDKLWAQYGFIDAFNLTTSWYDPDFLAIDQGPEIVMIENYRSRLLWNLFMSCPEVKAGMKKLGFDSPNL